MRSINIWKLLSYSIIGLILLPILTIFFYSFTAESENLAHLKETVLSEYVKNTLILLIGVGGCATIFGVVSAYLLSFYEIKYEKLFALFLTLPFVIPSYILGFIYSDLLGYYGYVHLFLKDLGVENYFDVLNINSLIVILSLALYPYIFLIVRASFLRHSSMLLNPALSLGRSRFESFRKILLPLSRPAIIGGLSLVLMETISEYGAVKYYGVDTLSTAIFTVWFGFEDPGSAAYISSIAMFIVLMILLFEKFSRGRAKYRVESISARAQKQKLTGLKKIFAYIFLMIPASLGFIIPFIWIVVYAFKYGIAIVDEDYYMILGNTFEVTILASLFILSLALLISYTTRVFEKSKLKYISKGVLLGYSVPGAVIAVGIIILAGDVDKYLIENFGFDELFFSGSVIILIFGYAVRFMAVGMNSVESNFENIGIAVNKASRNLGNNLLKTLFKVDLPLLRNGLISAFILLFIDVIKELPATLILRPFNYETLATKTYELAINEMVKESSIYALTIVLISFIPILITLRTQK